MAEEEVKTVRAHCPGCDGERVCSVHGHIHKPWEWSDRQGHSMNGGVYHSLLECRGCETVFYESSHWDSDEVDQWHDEDGQTQGEYVYTKATYPRPDSKTKPAWFDATAKIDEQLHRILTEMYVAYDNQAYILTAVGLRTALDRGTELLGIDPAKTFAEKLTELKDGGWIGDTEKDILEVVTDAGNAAAHRGWAPESHEVVQLMYALEVFIQRAFIVAKKALSIKSSIPPKPTRRAKTAAISPEKTA